MKTIGQRFYEAAFPDGALWDNLTLADKDRYEKGARALVEDPTEPAWVRAARSAFTTLLGLALIVVTFAIIRPTLDPQSVAHETLWIGLTFGGATLMGIGGSVFPRSPLANRGYGRLGLLIGLALAGIVAALFSGCGSTHVSPQRTVEHRWQESPCDFRAIVDGREVYWLTSPKPCPVPASLCKRQVDAAVRAAVEAVRP